MLRLEIHLAVAVDSLSHLAWAPPVVATALLELLSTVERLNVTYGEGGANETEVLMPTSRVTNMLIREVNLILVRGITIDVLAVDGPQALSTTLSSGACDGMDGTCTMSEMRIGRSDIPGQSRQLAISHEEPTSGEESSGDVESGAVGSGAWDESPAAPPPVSPPPVQAPRAPPPLTTLDLHRGYNFLTSARANVSIPTLLSNLSSIELLSSELTKLSVTAELELARIGPEYLRLLIDSAALESALLELLPGVRFDNITIRFEDTVRVFGAKKADTLHAGGIAGIVIGMLVCVVCGLCCVRRWQRRTKLAVVPMAPPTRYSVAAPAASVESDLPLVQSAAAQLSSPRAVAARTSRAPASPVAPDTDGEPVDSMHSRDAAYTEGCGESTDATKLGVPSTGLPKQRSCATDDGSPAEATDGSRPAEPSSTALGSLSAASFETCRSSALATLSRSQSLVFPEQSLTVPTGSSRAATQTLRRTSSMSTVHAEASPPPPTSSAALETPGPKPGPTLNTQRPATSTVFQAALAAARLTAARRAAVPTRSAPRLPLDTELKAARVSEVALPRTDAGASPPSLPLDRPQPPAPSGPHPADPPQRTAPQLHLQGGPRLLVAGGACEPHVHVHVPVRAEAAPPPATPLLSSECPAEADGGGGGGAGASTASVAAPPKHAAPSRVAPTMPSTAPTPSNYSAGGGRVLQKVYGSTERERPREAAGSSSSKRRPKRRTPAPAVPREIPRGPDGPAPPTSVCAPEQPGRAAVPTRSAPRLPLDTKLKAARVSEVADRQLEVGDQQLEVEGGESLAGCSASQGSVPQGSIAARARQADASQRAASATTASATAASATAESTSAFASASPSAYASAPSAKSREGSASSSQLENQLSSCPSGPGGESERSLSEKSKIFSCKSKTRRPSTVRKVSSSVEKATMIALLSGSVAEAKEDGISAADARDAGFTMEQLSHGVSHLLHPSLTLPHPPSTSLPFPPLPPLLSPSLPFPPLPSPSLPCPPLPSPSLNLPHFQVSHGGYSLRELMEADYPAAALRAAGAKARDLHNGRFTPQQLAKAGYTAAEMRDGGWSVAEVREAGFTAEHMRMSGRGSMRSLPLTAKQALGEGASVEQLLEKAGAEGFDPVQLKLAGVSAAQLKERGYSCAELYDAGFSPSELLAAGFARVELQALISAGS